MTFVITQDTPNNVTNNIMSMAYENSGGAYLYLFINKRVVTNATYRMMYGMGVPWIETGTEGKYYLNATYKVVFLIDTSVPSQTTYIIDSQTNTRHTYSRNINASYLSSSPPIVFGKEKYGTNNGFTGTISDIVIRNRELTETEINDYLTISANS